VEALTGKRAQGRLKDRRLRSVERELRRGEIAALSLDVFDTLLWRRVPRPVDAFFFLGRSLTNDGYLDPTVSPAFFSALRIEAERQARLRLLKTANVNEITLEEVYAEFPQHLLQASLAALVDQEVALEQRITFADLDLVELIRIAMEHDIDVALVSNTYFSAHQVRELLNRPSLKTLSFRTVLTSSDHRSGKGDDLYDIILNELAVLPSQVLHIGDDSVADGEAAETRGLRTLVLGPRSDHMTEVMQREQVIPRSGNSSVHFPPIHPDQGDFGLVALRGRAEHRAPSPDDAEGTPHWTFGSEVLGPVFTGFAEWVHRKAAPLNVQSLHCLMREGTLLTPLLNRSGEYLDTGIKAENFWLSRYVASRAAITRADEEELRTVLGRRYPPTVQEFCGTIGLSLDRLPDLVERADNTLDDARLSEDLIERIAQDPDLQHDVLAAATKLRRRLLAYLDRCTGPSDEALVLVDLGWGATTQSYLVKALRAEGIVRDVLGFYLLTTTDVVRRTLQGVRAEGFLAHGGWPVRDASVVQRSPEVLEQLTHDAIGSMLDLDQKCQPVLGPSRSSPLQVAQAAQAREGVLWFQGEWARYQRGSDNPTASLAEAREQLRTILRRFIEDPTDHEARLFADWGHDDNLGSETGDDIGSPELVAELRHLSPSQLLSQPTSRLLWPAGTATLHAPRLARAAQLVRSGLAPAHSFEHQLGHNSSELHAETGVEHRVASAPITVNLAGLSFASLTCELDDVRAVHLRPSLRPAVIRLDRIRLTTWQRGVAEPVHVTFETPSVLQKWRLTRGQWIGGNVVLVRDGYIELVREIPPARPMVYRVSVTVCFALLEIPQAWNEVGAPPPPRWREQLDALIRRWRGRHK
jgi:FMN phosphatase YigB (HAD superfamily)